MAARPRAGASPGVVPYGPEDPAARRERIMEAAADLFYEQGYDNTTLDEIAERLGVTKPVIYGQFGSKQDLLGEVASRGVLAALDAIRTALALEAGPTRKLVVFTQRLVTAALTHHRSIGILTREEMHLLPPDRERIVRLRGSVERELRSLLEEGKAAGEFRIHDVPVAALAIVGSVRCSFLWYRPDGRLSQPELAAEIGDLVLAMVGARTGAGRVRPARRRAPLAEAATERATPAPRAAGNRPATAPTLGRTKSRG